MGSERMCPTPGKRSYRNREVAEDAARSLRRNTKADPYADRLNAYSCACGRWHVGHAPGFRRDR